MITCNVGLIGLGTIGSGVVKILQKNADLLGKRTGVKVVLKKACDLRVEEGKKLGLRDEQLTNNFDDLVNDPDIHVIIELIGGYSPAKEFILKALQHQKHVVTANKAVIAKYGKEIFAEAQRNNLEIAFEAAVGGCIPIIKTIRESYAADTIQSIYGILNGTTNYILTQMGEGKNYADALKAAQKLGFAEADPSFDVEGKDAAQKLIILARLAFNADISEDILTEGITHITKQDLKNAQDLGYCIKLLGITKKENNSIEIRVHPTMIPVHHELASVRDELNAIYLISENTTKSMLYGKGAGQLPTATVVIGDVVDIAKGKKEVLYQEKVPIKDLSTIQSRYYLRFTVVDRPGVLAQLSKILGDNRISISGVQQKEVDKATVPVVIITHQAVEADIKKGIQEIDALEIVKEKTAVIRIEDIQ